MILRSTSSTRRLLLGGASVTRTQALPAASSSTSVAALEPGRRRNLTSSSEAVKPSLSDVLAPTSIPDPTLLEPLSTVFLSLPPSIALSYAAFIPLFTVAYRTATTLPVVLWQRRRTRRFAELVLPRLKREQAQLALQTRDECRRLGKSYEEYQKVFQKRAKTLAYSLAKKFRCSPRLTLILPPLVHIPIFITATLTLRDACTRAAASLGLSPTQLVPDDPASPLSYLSTTALEHLHELASTSFLWCPSLVLPDPTMLLPLAVGVVSLLNVELSAKNRLRQTEVDQDQLEGNAAPVVEGARVVSGSVSASEKRRIVARKAREGEHVRVRGYATVPRRTATPPPPPSRSVNNVAASDQSTVVAGGTKPNTARIVTNVLRFASVAFIPVAGLAPSAVCLYWIASNLFTMVQNGAFAVLDRRRDKAKRVGMILEGKLSARHV